MAASLCDRILWALNNATDCYHRLVLTVGSGGSGKTEALIELADKNGWPRLNVNLDLSEHLLELTQKQRAVRVAAILGDMVRNNASNVILLDNIG